MFRSAKIEVMMADACTSESSCYKMLDDGCLLDFGQFFRPGGQQLACP